MKALRTLPIALGLAVGLAACADAHAPSANLAAQPAAAQTSDRTRCFRPDDVNGWRAVNAETVNVGVGANRVFQMRLMRPCPDINWDQRIAIESTASPWICSGIDATLYAPSRIGPFRCPVTRIHELSPAEVAALPARERP